MNKITALTIVVFSGLSVFAQGIQNEIKINWKAPKEVNNPLDINSKTSAFLFFDGAIYPSEENQLPFFSTRLPVVVNNSNSLPVLVISNAQFELIPEQEKSLVNSKIGNKIEPLVWLQTERLQSYVRIEFLPIRRNQNTGQLERLTSFVPQISWKQTSSDSVSFNQSKDYKSVSVLNQGSWNKIAVKESGIHKISYDKLIELGFENPSEIRLFGNGGKQLPFDSSMERPDDLMENPIYLHKGTDGVFNSGDYILFYAKGIVHWQYDNSFEMFVHRLHQYTDEAFYYLTDTEGIGLRIQDSPEANGTVTQQVDSYDYHYFREKDSVNMLKSGRLWAWKHFNLELNYTYNIALENKLPSAPVEILSSLWVRSTKSAANSNFLIMVNDNPISTISFPGVNTGNYEALFATTALEKNEAQISGSEFDLGFQFVQSNPAANAWLDYFDINTRCKLTYSNKPLAFRDIESVGPGNISEFVISGGQAKLKLWDISTIDNIQSIQFRPSGNNLRFKAKTDELREFILFDPNYTDFPEPIFTGDHLGVIENQNLHGVEIPDMVIVVQNELREHAEELAEIHKTQDQLDCLIVEPHQIYNEFSSGIPDPTAIRDFLRMLYTRGSSSEVKLKYLLMFGDGSYDNKKASFDPEFRNCLPTYQSLESLYPTRSYVTDDFFGLLDFGENLETGLLDIGIGRFPVTTAYEAAVMVDKIKTYKSAETFGDWRNLICFIGDDEDGNSHMRDANTLAQIIANRYPTFNIDKIFLDAYQQVVTASGETYPEVNRAIDDRIKKGALIMNYLGHGSEKGLAHENILTVSDIRSWDNYNKLPLFMTATCEFSRFDDHEKPSAGEEVLLNSQGGGIGLFTTTRLVYSSPNFRLNREFYDYAFEQNNREKYRFGDLLRLTKNAVGSELNKLNFTLLADPALTLNYPEHKIIMTELNGKPIAEYNDTLKALSKVQVKGYIADYKGEKLTDYHGIVNPTVYDKEMNMSSLSNDGGAPMEFTVQENILFRGKSSISDGEFSFNFIVPKDISYNVGTGKFSFYGTDGSSDAAGVNLSVNIGGSADSLIQDSDGPQVKLFMNDTTFVYGGTTDQNPILIARLSDSNGINTTGNGIGHDVTAILDGNTQDVIVLNDYYESDLDNYQTGTIRYPINDLEPGVHDLQLKVWDILNNSSEAEIRFEVYSEEQMILKNLINYPNPFTTNTAFYFEHNQAGSELDAQIQIYTVSGRLVKSFDFLSATETQINSGTFRVGPVYWDGLDQFGDRIGRGTYFYRVRIRTADGRTQEAFQKLVKL